MLKNESSNHNQLPDHLNQLMNLEFESSSSTSRHGRQQSVQLNEFRFLGGVSHSCLFWLLVSTLLWSPGTAQATPEFVIDMVHRNPGDDYPASKFVDPQFLASWGYMLRTFLAS
jgi:hypothetical protein